MTRPHIQGQQWAFRALSSEVAGSPAEIQERVDALLAICEQYAMPVEVLISWIHTKADGKEWSGREFGAYCEHMRRYADSVAEAAGVPAICAHCGAPLATREAAIEHACGGENADG